MICKASNKSVNFPLQFCPGWLSNKFGYSDSEEVSIKVNVYHFSVDYDVIDTSSILNFHKYLLVEQNV